MIGTIVAGGQPALVFQHHALAHRLTARDNVLVGALGRIGFLRAALGLWPRWRARRPQPASAGSGSRASARGGPTASRAGSASAWRSPAP